MSFIAKCMTLCYLVLALLCFLVCYVQIKSYLGYPLGTSVDSGEPLGSGDIPWMAICPQQALNISALDAARMNLIKDVTNASANSSANWIRKFGIIAEAEGMTSDEVLKFYRDILLTRDDVVSSAVAKLENGSSIDLLKLDEVYVLPNSEAGDCPVILAANSGFGIPGLTQIRWEQKS